MHKFFGVILLLLLVTSCTKNEQINNQYSENNNISIDVFKKEKIKGVEEFDKIVSQEPPVIMEKELASKIDIAFLGDIMIGSRVGDAIDEEGLDFAFSGTRDYLSEKDAVIFNLETPITDTGIKYNKKYVFKAKKEHLVGLKTFNNLLVANLANNHIGDYGEEGLKNTLINLENNGIEYFGAGYNKKSADALKIIDIEGVKIGLIGQVCIWPTSYEATETKVGNSFFNKDLIKEEINKGRELGVDIIVYNMHCGDEYKNGPNSKQIDYAHFAIDNGADLVIGHHPHWYQPIEIYKGKSIFYSLGNYIFDIDRGRRAEDGIIVNIEIEAKSITKVGIEPIKINGFGNTVFQTKEKKDFILNEIFNLSMKFGKIETIKEGYIDIEYLN